MSAVSISPGMEAVMGPVVLPNAGDAVASAAHRLEISRNRIHQAVGVYASQKPRSIASSLLAGPVERWWKHHPLRVATHVTADAAKVLVEPVAQRHPVVLVAGAAAVGAFLVWTQPWRWLLTPALVAGLLPKLISQIVASRSPRA